MAHYFVYYVTEDGKEDYEHYFADSKETAKYLFEKYYPERVIRVDNVSVEKGITEVAYHLLEVLKKSNNKKEQLVGYLSKEISVLATVLAREFHADMHNEPNLHASTIAKKIYDIW